MKNSTIYYEKNKQNFEHRVTLLNLSKLVELWELTGEDTVLLLNIQPGEAQGDSLPDIAIFTREQKEALTYLIALHTFLMQLFKFQDIVCHWLKTPLDRDSITRGISPLEYMKKHHSILEASIELQQWVNLHLL